MTNTKQTNKHTFIYELVLINNNDNNLSSEYSKASTIFSSIDIVFMQYKDKKMNNGTLLGNMNSFCAHTKYRDTRRNIDI